MTTFLTLPPHLLETITELVQSDVDLPAELKDGLGRAISSSDSADVRDSGDGGTTVPQRDVSQEDGLATGKEEPQRGNEDEGEDEDTAAHALIVIPPKPRTIELEVVERLSRWASGEGNDKRLRKCGLDPPRYSTISLLAGTEVYIPPSELERLRTAENPEKPNPYLPSYLSPTPSSFGSEFRSLSRTLSTAFNVLFSIFGSAAAVYVASTSGAGYSRETAVLLAVLAGAVVGVADVVLVIIFTKRVEEGRKERHGLGRKMMSGSGAMGDDGPPLAAIEGTDISDLAEGEGGTTTTTIVDKEGTTAIKKRQVRLRRKGLNEG